MNTQPEMTPAERIAAFAAEHGLTLESTFVPFSQSRHAKGEKPWRSLNWTVRLMRADREILTTDYAQGEAYAPAYKIKASNPYDRQCREDAISLETETGRIAIRLFGTGSGKYGPGRRHIPAPSIVDVLYSLSSDASVLDAGCFENWAADCGYDTDSRKAETTYRACFDIALKMRAALGDAGLEALQIACQDY